VPFVVLRRGRKLPVGKSGEKGGRVGGSLKGEK